MALTTQERGVVSSKYMSDRVCPGQVLKTDLTDAIVAADDWLDTNLPSLNAAIPAAFRTAATATEKYMLLTYILMKRMAKI